MDAAVDLIADATDDLDGLAGGVLELPVLIALARVDRSIAGALSRSGYEAGLAAAGFEQVSVAFTHQVGKGLHSAIIKATKPTNADSAITVTAGWPDHTADGLRLGLLLTHQRPAVARRAAGAGVEMPGNG